MLRPRAAVQDHRTRVLGKPQRASRAHPALGKAQESLGS
jgi:hypothetical protein